MYSRNRKKNGSYTQEETLSRLLQREARTSKSTPSQLFSYYLSYISSAFKPSKEAESAALPVISLLATNLKMTTNAFLAHLKARLKELSNPKNSITALLTILNPCFQTG